MDQNASPKLGFSKLALLIYQCAVFLCIPAFFVIHCYQGAKLSRFGERLGFGLGDRPKAPTIWFHAASLGELKQIEHVAYELYKTHGYAIVVTTFTNAGAEWAAQNLTFATHRFAPIDLIFVIKRLLKKFEPTKLVIVENEIWPCMLVASKEVVGSITILNARSSSSRSKRSKFHKQAMTYVDAVTCSSDAVAKEFANLNLAKDKIHQVANLKSAPLTLDEKLISRFRSATKGRKTWVAASTHASDEKIVLDAVTALQTADADAFLIWAPRHQTRIKSITTTLTQAKQRLEKRSSAPSKDTVDILLLDTLGELASALFVADIVYLGGGLATEGGHNPYEPAQLGKPILSGPNVINHQHAFDEFQDQGLVNFVTSGEDIARYISAASRHQTTELPADDNLGNVSQTIDILLGS